MNNDLVSREAVEQIFSKMWFTVRQNQNLTDEEIKQIITKGRMELNRLQPAQQWIPWGSGKFPEESGTYTVTAYDGATKRVIYAKYQKRLKWWELTGARAYWRVLAWQPKPKPWEGEENR